MAIWRHLLRPLLPWLGGLVVAILLLLGIGYVGGLVLIARAEPVRDEALPAGVPGRLIQAGGRSVHVVEAGDGAPIILVHGYAGSTYDWEEHVLGQLAQTHRVIAVDLLGMGHSARGADLAYGYDLWARQIVDVLDALGLERAMLVGHSLGGGIVSIVAGEHPERVDRLVLVAPLVPLESSERALFFRMLAIPGVGEAFFGMVDHLPRLPGFSDAYHARAHEVFRRAGTRHALLRYGRHGRDDARLFATYKHIRAPTLIVYGVADDIVPYTAVRRVAPAIHDSLVLPIEGAGHWIMRDEAPRLLDAIEHFDEAADPAD